MDPTAVNQKLIALMEARVSAGASIDKLGCFTEVLTHVDALTAMQLDRDELGDDEQWYDTWDDTLHRHKVELEKRRQEGLHARQQNKFGGKYFESLYTDVMVCREAVTVSFHRLRALPKHLAFVHRPTVDEMLQCAQEVYATTFNRSLVRIRIANELHSPVQTRLMWFSGKEGESPDVKLIRTYRTRRL